MNHSTCKTDNTLELHPTSPIPVGYRDEISVINVFRVRVEEIGMMNPELSVAGIGMKIYQILGGFSSLLSSTASLKMKALKAPVNFIRFHLYFQT